MSQQPTWAQIETATQAAIASAAGLAGTSVIWSWQNFDSPAYPYARLSLGVPIMEGWDSLTTMPVSAWAAATPYALDDRVINDSGKTYTCTTAGTSAGSGGPTGTGPAIADGSVVWAFVAIGGEIQIATSGWREIALTVEVFTSAVVDSVGTTARQIAEQVRTKMRLPGIRGAMAAVQLVPFMPGNVNWLPDLVSVGFRGRAALDIRCWLPARVYAEYAGYIARIQGTTEAEVTGGTVTEDFEAPPA